MGMGRKSKPKITMFFLEELIDKARNLWVPCGDQDFWLIAVIAQFSIDKSSVDGGFAATLDTVDGRVTEKSGPGLT